MTTQPIRLAFTHIPRRAWAGGYNYQLNLFSALHAHQPGRIAPVVFAGSAAAADELAELAGVPAVEVLRSKAFDSGSSSGVARAVLLGLDSAAASAFADAQIDVVIEMAKFFGWRLPLPAVAWFPDFQHRLLPRFFSRRARLKRELGFRIQIASGRTIMVSSNAARQDCEKFYPSLKGRVQVVRFATRPSPDLLQVAAEDAIARYQLPATYFYLPNQFHSHKNHQVVIDALDLLKQRGRAVAVVASGSPANPLHPNYFSELMAQGERRGLADSFRLLGMIPLGDVYALLRSSAGLINPSHLEGWSTTVEEAKSFGTPMILSDIAVHREQAADAARYFATDDPSSLADHLEAASETFVSQGPRQLRAELDVRVAAFAQSFIETVETARHRY
jgi:glycosyltransferase involved in cell wall biosynthesis